MRYFGRVVAPIFLVLGAASASAHHNTGAYFDTEVEMTIDGVIDTVQWRNPHVYFTITGTVESGAEETWRIEAGPTGIMRRLDWDQNTLLAGDAVTVTANPSRREDKKSGYLVSVAAEGRSYPSLRGEEVIGQLAVDNTEVEETATSIAGTWTTLFNGEYFGKLFGEEGLPLTDEGLASQESFDELTDAPALECIPSVAPSMMAIPDIKLIEVDENQVRIRGEFYNSERVIYLDASDAPTGRTLHGRSVGRWEDGALVVETDLFGEHRAGVTFAVASSPKKKLLERIRLDDDGKSLSYSFFMIDPEMMTEPLTGDFKWIYRPDIEYESLPCDLENSRQYIHD